jgi:AdoMet-dependent heme synthase
MSMDKEPQIVTSTPLPSEKIKSKLQIVAWEITRSCNLYCSHCRASAESGSYPGELSTQECLNLVDQITALGRPMIILSGGEPLFRKDVFEIGRYASEHGSRVVMGTNGTLITPDIARRLKEVPFSRISVSLDFPIAELQDKFRGQSGAFEAALRGIRNAREAGVEVQINSTISRMNVRYLSDLINMALEVGAVAFHPFMLVPTGRGKGLADEELSPQEYEDTLEWICRKQVELGEKLMFKPTDAPHYYRVASQCGVVVGAGHGHRPGSPGGGNSEGMNSYTRGCLAGVSYCFVSHVGKVNGCGYLNLEAGDVKKESFARIWEHSPLFQQLRDLSNLKGKCGECEYKRICGGCRARAYETTGDHLAAEPYCVYQPRSSARRP